MTMALPLAAIPIIGGLLDKILDKVAKDKVDDATMEQLKQEAEKMLRDEGQQEIQQFYDFVLDYEGRAEDHGRFIQWLRGSVRPVLTYVFSGCFLYIVYLWATGGSVPLDPDTLKLMAENPGFALQVAQNQKIAFQFIGLCTLLCLFFWFGGRAVRDSGILEMFKSVFLSKPK